MMVRPRIPSNERIRTDGAQMMPNILAPKNGSLFPRKGGKKRQQSGRREWKNSWKRRMSGFSLYSRNQSC